MLEISFSLADLNIFIMILCIIAQDIRYIFIYTMKPNRI